MGVMENDLTVHLYSFIEPIDVHLKEALPSVNLKHVKFPENLSKVFSKIVTEEEISQLQDARILITDAYLLSKIHNRLPNVEWIQLTYAGVETLTSVVNSKNKPSYPVCRNGAFGQAMKEYVVSWVINHERAATRIPQMKNERGWYKLDMVHFRTLDQLTIGVMGLGAIGSSIVWALKAMGCKVHGYGRSKEPTTDAPLNAYWNMNQLDELLENCDYIVNVLPSTHMTKYLLGGNRLSPAKKRKPVLINAGRGDIISEQDLIRALDNDWISHAILDVYEQEPLSKESSLWNHPKVTLTPHVATFSTGAHVVPVFLENLRRRASKEPLLYPVDFDKAY